MRTNKVSRDWEKSWLKKVNLLIVLFKTNSLDKISSLIFLFHPPFLSPPSHLVFRFLPLSVVTRFPFCSLLLTFLFHKLLSIHSLQLIEETKKRKKRWNLPQIMNDYGHVIYIYIYIACDISVKWRGGSKLNHRTKRGKKVKEIQGFWDKEKTFTLQHTVLHFFPTISNFTHTVWWDFNFFKYLNLYAFLFLSFLSISLLLPLTSPVVPPHFFLYIFLWLLSFFHFA